MNGRSDRVQSSQQVNSETQESSNEDFFDQFFLNLPWADLGYGNSKASPEYPFEGGEAVQLHQLCDESLLLASRLRQNQIAGIPRNVNPGDSTLLLGGSRNDAEPTFNLPGPPGGEASFPATSQLSGIEPQPFNHAQGFNGGTATTPPRQKVRARRGQATDPHSIAERLRRERIAERMKALQELVPNANKTDKASMLDEIIDYVKFLQLQVKVLSMSRLGGVAPFTADVSSQRENEGMTAAEQQVAKLMEQDMGAAMQYLQGKGLCLMPISLASAISTATNSTISDLSLSANNQAS